MVPLTPRRAPATMSFADAGGVHLLVGRVGTEDAIGAVGVRRGALL